MEKMAKNIQLKQKEMMINFMEDNYQLLFGKFSNESGRSNKDEKWKLLCVLLNDAGPPTKSIDKWKRVNIFFVIFLSVFCLINTFDFEFYLVMARHEIESKGETIQNTAAYEQDRRRTTARFSIDHA